MAILKSFFILLLTINLYANNLDNADIKYATGDYIQASKIYEKILKKNPNNNSVKLKLIGCYSKLGDNFSRVDNFKKALYWYKKALNLNKYSTNIKIAKVYTKQAKLFYRIKDYKKALKLYKKALKLGYSKVRKDIKIVKKHLNHKKALKNDTRKLVTSNSPEWTKAIGRLITPTELTFISKTRYRTKYKKCSASIVNFDNYSSSRVIITASHCITGYNPKAGNLRFIIKNSNGDMVQKFAKIYKDSHYIHNKTNKHTDYAILILDSPITKKDIEALKTSNIPFDILQNQYKYSFASLAGFSGDIGDYGAKLTIDPKCKLFDYNDMYGKSNCAAYKGASGGPVVLSVSNDNKNFKHYLVGIVSHFKNKNFKHIYFTPNNKFYTDLEKVIKKFR